MPGRASSKAYVGRRAELDALRQALVDAGTERGHVVLVGGEAGIGKSRLFEELARSATDDPPAGRPVRIVKGGCSELAAGTLPYLPVLDVLDGLVESGRPAAPLLQIRDELAGASDEAPTSRSRTFLAFRDAVVSAAQDEDLVLVVDDLHWADRSTLEFLAFLAPRLGAARVVLAAAYRSDELHRRHPLRPVLVELDRGSLVHLRLAPLTPDDVAAQVTGIIGSGLPAPDVTRIVELAEGNPFFVEELVALEDSGSGLPPSVRDLAAARLARLSEAATAVLSGSAIIGRDVDPELLAAVVSLEPDELRSALREVADQHILRPTPDGRRYRFRHALLAEAVRDDQLPNERVRLHRQLATVLAERPELGAESTAGAAAEIAHHWSQAGDRSRAYPAWVEAGRAAHAARAWREAADGYEQALGLAAGGDAALAPSDLAELAMSAAIVAALAGDPRRALAHAKAAVAVDDHSDPARSAVWWADLAGYANDAGEFDLEHSASDRSIELMPRGTLSHDLAEVLANHASSLRLRGEYRVSLVEGDDARRVCAIVGANDLLLELDAHAAQARAYLGHADAALAALHAIDAAGDQLFGLTPWQIGNVVINTMAGLYFAGCFAEVLELDAQFVPAFADRELRAWVPWLDMCAGGTQFHLGDWSDAGLRIDRDQHEPLIGFLAWGRETRRRWLLGARGEARPAVWGPAPEPREAPDPVMRADLGAADALACLWNNDPVEAARVADEALDALVGSEEVAMTAWVVAVAIRAWADVAEAARATRRSGDLARALSRVAALDGMAAAIEAAGYLDGGGTTPFMRTLCATSHAERGRAEDHPDARAWRAVAAAYDNHGTRPAAAYARYRLAEALLGEGDEDGAATNLVEVLRVATEIGGVPLARLAGNLARRARLRLEPPSPPPELTPPNPWGLSDREQAVLDLIGEGRTNREIGDALFITDKTASAHVSHILAKLGVSSRTEAALLAARAGAVDAGG